MNTPILFLVFNRPDVTSRVFDAIRSAKPRQLFVAADGPRPGKEGEEEACAQTRAIATQIDWPCELHTLFQDENLGCRRAISGAITWFFEQVEEGIILEDDCLPDKSFFPYCAELLERYRNDPRIMCVSGDNSFQPQQDQNDGYTFSSLPLIWGWATWRRAWNFFDYDEFVSGNYDRVVRSVNQDPRFVQKSINNFRATASGAIDSWAYVWSYSVITQSGLTCVPRVNLIQNIGFRTDATHTTDGQHPRADCPTQRAKLPLVHPRYICRDSEFDAAVFESLYGTKPIPPVVYKISRRWHRFKRVARL